MDNNRYLFSINFCLHCLHLFTSLKKGDYNCNSNHVVYKLVIKFILAALLLLLELELIIIKVILANIRKGKKMGPSMWVKEFPKRIYGSISLRGTIMGWRIGIFKLLIPLFLKTNFGCGNLIGSIFCKLLHLQV